MNKGFKLVSNFEPTGDQPQAIEKLVEGLNKGYKFQTLLGVTGSGKTFTMANIIEKVQRPTLVIAHNKTLAAQLYSEFRTFFPYNAVEYFISYYDYYQPEAYIPQTDTYIEKDASINDEIDRMRHSATQSLMERRDVIVVASVSCIYGLGSPEDYQEITAQVRVGDTIDRESLLDKLVDLQYERNDTELSRGMFRARGDIIEIFPSSEEVIYRIDSFGDTVERIIEFDPVTGEVFGTLSSIVIYPAKHFVTTRSKLLKAVESIKLELEERVRELREKGKLLEAQRLESRTMYDIEMLLEIGYCPGIENYSRHLSGRKPGERPYTLIDYFPKDFLLFIDESHVTVPQLNGMYEGDRSRKETLVEYGFRLPSALDNRPLKFDEFISIVGQTIFVSATPGPYELDVSAQIAEQLIRPTGVPDPEIQIKPTEGQIDDLIKEIQRTVESRGRVLVTTLTKRMAEDLSQFLKELNIKVTYIHSEIDAIERVKIIKGLRSGRFDVVVGINLLREGLDLPEVELVAILDADKEGFLRSERSLIQVMGRAARNINGRVIMYADLVTSSMKRAIEETNRRRLAQLEYNKAHNITPTTIKKEIRDLIQVAEEEARYETEELSKKDIARRLKELEKEMHRAAENLEFERAANIRDEIIRLREILGQPVKR
ncbi:MAG: excinuclease ABC subunit UvrB [bacterium]